MRTCLMALSALAWIGCGSDGGTADLGVPDGCYMSSAPGCCPSQDQTGLPPDGLACSPAGSTCKPGASDVICKCEATGWHCHGTLHIGDMARPRD